MTFDPRLTPARTDLAASSLKGTVVAPRYADGKLHTIVRGRISLRAAPSADARQETELLFGQKFTVYEHQQGWAWGQSETDGYVGYIHTIACQDGSFTPDYRLAAMATPLLPAPDIKRPPLDMLFMNAQVQVTGRVNGFAKIVPDGYVRERHLAPIGTRAPDWVATAEGFAGTPYVWGGITRSGMDCSGLVQTALLASGRACPRDTDMQERALGTEVETPLDHPSLKRGDLVFWNGHVALALDADTLLHANSFHMEVAREGLAEALQRIAPLAGPVTSVRRL